MDSDQTLAVHVDRISTLPDDVISNNILSLLPTRDSVRTSVLSTRWKHLYASVPVLHFHHHSHYDRTDPAFAGFVYNVINAITTTLSRLSKVHISLSRIPVSSSDIISWIETATSHFVQELEVYCFDVELAVTPHSLFTCETLVSLKLDLWFVLSVPDNVCLPKLKNLSLKKLKIRAESDDVSVRRLFSSCPVLESLMVDSRELYFTRVFNVSVPSLKSLSLSLHNCRIELLINCPNLEELNCECYAARGYTGDVLRSLKKCDIDFYLYGDELQQGKLIELVRQVCKVESLTLDCDAMRALLFPPNSLPTFENLTHLELQSDIFHGWQLLPSILDSSPRLQNLIFRRGFYDVDHSFGNRFPLPEHVPVCLTFHLKLIRFDRFMGEEDEYKWVEYFLKNALVLEKMKIRLCSSEDSEEESDPSVEGELDGEEEGQPGEGVEEGEGEEAGQPGEVEGEGEGEGQEEGEEQYDPNLERYLEISKQLLTFQRASEVCQIVLVSSDYEDDKFYQIPS